VNRRRATLRAKEPMHRPAWSFLGSPHETEKIVRFGRNAERGDERCVGICLSGVYLRLT